MSRFVVVGGPGAGKSTVAGRLADRLGTQAIELDSLWWDPGWRPAGRDALRSRLAPFLDNEQWVVEGNYIAEIADLVWPRADAVIWLDPPRALAVRRAVGRSLKRMLTRSALWNGNKESITVLSPTSIRRLVQRWPSYSAEIDRVTHNLRIDPERIVHLRTDREVDHWLTTLEG